MPKDKTDTKAASPADRRSADQKRRRTRRAVALSGGVVVFALIITLVYVGRMRRSAPASVVPPPSVAANKGTSFHQSAKYAKELTRQNSEQAKQAEKSGTSFVPAPVDVTKQVTALSSISPTANLAPLGPSPVPSATPRAPTGRALGTIGGEPNRAPQGSYANSNGALAQAMDQELHRVTSTLTPVAQQTAVYETSQGTSPPAGVARRAAPSASTQAAAKEATSPVQPGDLFYAVMDTSLDSDTPGPALATIVQGPAKGAKVMGGFTRQDQALVVKFSTLVLPSGKRYRVTAYAVDPTTSRTAVESNVNNHYLSRWGGLIAGSFLAGYGQAVQMSGTTQQTIAGPGGVTTITGNPNLSTNKQLKVAAGRTAQQFQTLAQHNFNRPPTVKLAVGTGIGVLIINVSTTKTRDHS